MTLTADASPASANAGSGHRLLVTVRRPSDPTYRPLGFLSYDGATYSFAYLRGAVDSDDFLPLPGLTRDPRSRFTSTRLFPLFSERVISARRPDRESSLTSLGLPAGASPIEILARSGGQRTGDYVELLPVPTADPDGHVRLEFLVHGVRYVDGESERISRLQPGDPLHVLREPANAVNPNAHVVLDADDGRLGWLPDPLTDLVGTLSGARARVLRANGPEVGFHLRLLATLTGRLPAGEQPLSGPSWVTY